MCVSFSAKTFMPRTTKYDYVSKNMIVFQKMYYIYFALPLLVKILRSQPPITILSFMLLIKGLFDILLQKLIFFSINVTIEC